MSFFTIPSHRIASNKETTTKGAFPIINASSPISSRKTNNASVGIDLWLAKFHTQLYHSHTSRFVLLLEHEILLIQTDISHILPHCKQYQDGQRRLPIILLESVSFMSFPLVSRLSLAVVLIGVLKCFEDVIPNFFSNSQAYFGCDIKIPESVCLNCNPRKKESSPAMLMSNSRVNLSANLSVKISKVEPNTISST